MAVKSSPAKVEKILSLSGIARALDLSYPAAISLHEGGNIGPGPTGLTARSSSESPALPAIREAMDQSARAFR